MSFVTRPKHFKTHHMEQKVVSNQT